MKYYAENIEKQTLNSSDYRRVLFTGKNSQLVLMCIKPGEEIGTEIHEGHDQFFRIEAGKGQFIIDGEVFLAEDGFAVVVPAGVEHNLTNVGTDDLKIYTIYSPPEHPEGTIHKTKSDSLTSNH